MKIKNIFRTVAMMMAVLLAASMLSICAAAAEGANIAVSSAKGAAGETVDLTLSLENNPGIVSLMLDLKFDEKLKLTALNPYTADSDPDDPTTLLPKMDWGTEMLEDNPAAFEKNPKRISWSNDTSRNNIDYSGTVLTMSFQIPADAQIGDTYEVSVEYDNEMDMIFNVDVEAVEFATSAGTITVIPALTKVDAKDATCTEPGNIEYYVDKETGKLYKDKEASEEIAEADTVIPALGHDLTKVDAVAPTETTAGNIEYYKCNRCGKLFTDAEGKTETTAEAVVLAPVAHTHTLTKVEAKAATATEDGNIEYYKCEGCGKLFKDAEGKTEITLADTVIPKTGKPGSPQTGDTSMLVVMSVSMVLAAAAVVTAVVLKKKVND